MRNILGCCIFFMLMMTSQIFADTVYYVDATYGNDYNPGTNPEQAWKSIAKLNSSSFSPGDTIKFKRSNIWNLTYQEPEWKSYWIIHNSGTPGNYITIEDYGTGEKPIISSIETISGGWAYEGGNVWSKDVPGTLRRCMLDRVDSGKAPKMSDIDGRKYLWHFDSDNNLLYVYSKQNPDDEYNSVEIMRIRDVIQVKNASRIRIRNLRLEGGANIQFYGTCSHIEILDCDLWYASRTAISAYVTEGSGNSINHVTIEGNDIDGKLNLIDKAIPEYAKVNENGIALSVACEHWIIRNNIIQDFSHNLIGLAAKTASEAGVNDNLIEYNELYGGNSFYIRAYGTMGADGKCQNNIFRYNLIKDCNVRTQIGGNNNEFYNNIFVETSQSLVTNKNDISSALKLATWKESGMDLVCHDNKVYNNVIYGVYNEGISTFHSTSTNVSPHSNIIKNNIIMDAGRGGNKPDLQLHYRSHCIRIKYDREQLFLC